MTHRRGFTLTELLVVIAIMSILLAMTITAVNFNRDAERVRSAAMQVQSFLNGARDRAIYYKEPRGVRFFVDPINFRAVSSMVYIDPAESWDQGVIQLQRWDLAQDGLTDASPADVTGDGTANEDPTQVRVVAGAGTAWWELKRRGLLFDGLRIRIPKGPRGTWYSINTRLIDITSPPTAVQRLILGIPYADPGDTPTNKALAFESGGPEDYELELPPRILPMDPVLLPENTVIDLDGSKIPDFWRPVAGGSASSGNLQYSGFIDIVFSPRGNVIGGASSGGVIHFYVCDNEDSIALKDAYVPSNPAGTYTFAVGGEGHNLADMIVFNAIIRGTYKAVPSDAIDPSLPGSAWAAGIADPGEPYKPADRRIVTVFTQTGAISIHPVNAVDGDNDGWAEAPYLYAETGETAN